MANTIDPQQQLIRFREGVELLGGQRATARALGVNERTIRALYGAERPCTSAFFRTWPRPCASMPTNAG
jgi:hypothetical protein